MYHIIRKRFLSRRRYKSTDWNVNQAGPYRTGYISVEETYTDYAGEERTITVNIWYPTDDEEGDIGVYVGYLEDENVLLNAHISDSVHEDGYSLSFFHTEVLDMEVILPFLMHHLTDGLWFLAPDHKGNSVLDYGEDQVPMIKVWRAQDNQASISALDQLEWSEQVNTENIPLSGHSFGSWDNWLLGGGILDPNALDTFLYAETEFSDLAQVQKERPLGRTTDERIKGIVPMAGAKYFEWFAEKWT